MSATGAPSQSTVPATLGDHIAAARRAKGYRQTDMARAMPCDQFRYQCIESGREIPTLAQRRRIAALLDLDDAELAALPTRVDWDADGRITRELNQQPTDDEDAFQLFEVPAVPAPRDLVLGPPTDDEQPTTSGRTRPTVRYHEVRATDEHAPFVAAVNAALQRIQSHTNAPVGQHMPATPPVGRVDSVTTSPETEHGYRTVSIVYVADRDLFRPESAESDR